MFKSYAKIVGQLTNCLLKLMTDVTESYFRRGTDRFGGGGGGGLFSRIYRPVVATAGWHLSPSPTRLLRPTLCSSYGPAFAAPGVARATLEFGGDGSDAQRPAGKAKRAPANCSLSSSPRPAPLYPPRQRHICPSFCAILGRWFSE